MKDYHINVFYSEEDGCYVADIPDLRFCSVFGKTPQEAVVEALIARDLWIESARKHGTPVPRTRYKPVIFQGLGNSVFPVGK